MNRVQSGIFIYILLQPVHAFLYVFQGVGVGKPDMAFSAVAEINSRGNAHSGLFQDIKGQLVGIS